MTQSDGTQTTQTAAIFSFIFTCGLSLCHVSSTGGAAAAWEPQVSVVSNRLYVLSVCAHLTVQSTPVRTSLLGPLDAGGREGWGGPRCCRPEREIAFLRMTRTKRCVCVTQLAHHRAQSYRELDFSGFNMSIHYSCDGSTPQPVQLEICGGGEVGTAWRRKCQQHFGVMRKRRRQICSVRG